MIYFSNDIRTVLWFAVIPAIIAVFIILFKVEEPKDEKDNNFKTPINFSVIKKFSKQFWFVVVVVQCLCWHVLVKLFSFKS